jgi:hypothetical protein
MLRAIARASVNSGDSPVLQRIPVESEKREKMKAAGVNQ